MTLLAIYAGSLVLGGILIGASMLGGGKDTDGDGPGGGDSDLAKDVDLGKDIDLAKDVDLGKDIDLAKDIDLDHTHDHGHAHTDVLTGIGTLATTVLSLRFWTFASGAFGMTGLLLTLLAVNPIATLALSVVTGVGVGSGVTTLLRAASRDTVSSALDARTLRGRDAEVILAIGPGKLGKVRLVHNGQIIELPGTTKESRRIERGERVLVVDVTAGTADVTPAEPDRRPPSAVSTTS